MPQNTLRALERGGALLEELQDQTPEEAIERRRDALRELIAPCDTVLLLGQLLMKETRLDPQTYRETEHEGLAAIVEFVAAELAARPTRAGVAPHTPVMDANLLGPVHDLVHEVMLIASLGRARRVGARVEPEADARNRMAMQHLMLRGPGWQWQEEATLRGLFGPPHLAAKLKEKLGFTVDDGIACARAATKLISDHYRIHVTQVQEELEALDDEHPALEWARSELSGWENIPSKHRAKLAFGTWALVHMGDALLFTSAELGTCADVDPSIAWSFMQGLKTSLGGPADDWFAAADAVRRRPYLEIQDDVYMPTVPGNDLWALRGTFESALKGDKGFLRHRARWLEEQATARIADSTQADERHSGLTYEYRDDSGSTLQGEIDGLVRIGDVALILEAKSATMRPGARRGGDAFLSHLQENLTKAAEQGTRATSALRAGAPLRQGKDEIHLGAEIREVHSIVVTLDDLSSVAPILWQLQGTRILPVGTTVPWLLSLHDLDLICQTIEWPAQMVHFLRRRARLNLRGGVDAADELDLWMHYLAFGMYFDDTEEDRIRLTSFTDELDAWVLHEQGMRETPAQKPRMNLDDETRAFLDLLCDERPPPAWAAAASVVLDMNGAGRVEFWDALREIRNRTIARERPQRCTLDFPEDLDPMIVCGAVVPDDDDARLPEVLRELVAERLAEHGIQRVLAIGRAASSTRPYDALVVVDRSWRELPTPDDR